MSFRAYLDAVEAKTGKSVADLRALAEARGYVEGGGLRRGVKAGDILDWLKTDFGLGRGHGMSVVAVLKGDKNPEDA